MSNVPFLVNYATARISSPEIIGHYCNKIDMWVETKTQKPLIEFSDLAELSTKTKVKEEQDDDSPYLLEVMTKTNVNVERDDTDLRFNHLNELMTKTDVIQESDDTNFEYSFV